MIKYILIVSFLLVSAASIFGWLDIGFDSFSEASNIIEQKELKDKIKVPEGMEKEYQAILAHNVEVQKEQVANQPQQTTPAQNKTQISDAEAKQQVQDFLAATPATQKEPSKTSIQSVIQTAPQQKQPIAPQSNDKKFLTKTTALFVKHDNLIVSLKIHNASASDFNGVLTLVCTAKNAQNKPVDVFSWTGKLNIPSKKTVLLQEANFGYINISEEVTLHCEVE